jgi:hypothetical protein
VLSRCLVAASQGNRALINFSRRLSGIGLEMPFDSPTQHNCLRRDQFFAPGPSGSARLAYGESRKTGRCRRGTSLAPSLLNNTGA